MCFHCANTLLSIFIENLLNIKLYSLANWFGRPVAGDGEGEVVCLEGLDVVHVVAAGLGVDLDVGLAGGSPHVVGGLHLVLPSHGAGGGVDGQAVQTVRVFVNLLATIEFLFVYFL